MTLQEFSNEFDLLFNNITSNQAPGLDEYEKSVFLTKAQDEIIKNYFNPKGNKYQEGFDGNAKRQIDFSMILKTDTITTSTSPSMDKRSNVVSVSIPEETMMIVNESLIVTRDGREETLVVMPLDFFEYMRLLSKPFKRPLKFQAWRVFTNDSKQADIIPGPNDTFESYIIRYVKRPNPIILTDLTNENVSIGGIKIATECELDPILHTEILQRAVELAKAAWVGDINSSIELGKRSE